MCNPNLSTPGVLPTGSSWREETLGLLSWDLSGGWVPAVPGHSCCLREPPADSGGRPVRAALMGPGGCLCRTAPGLLSPLRDSLGPSPGAGLLYSSGAFGVWRLGTGLMQPKAPASCL